MQVWLYFIFAFCSLWKINIFVYIYKKTIAGGFLQRSKFIYHHLTIAKSTNCKKQDTAVKILTEFRYRTCMLQYYLRLNSNLCYSVHIFPISSQKTELTIIEKSFFNIIFLHTFLSASKVYVYNPSVSLNTI